MIESLFGTYFGLDWASMVLGFWGSWIIGNRNRTGFVLIIASLILAFGTAVIAEQYGFLVANAISIVIAARNWAKWAPDPDPAPAMGANGNRTGGQQPAPGQMTQRRSEA